LEDLIRLWLWEISKHSTLKMSCANLRSEVNFHDACKAAGGCRFAGACLLHAVAKPIMSSEKSLDIFNRSSCMCTLPKRQFRTKMKLVTIADFARRTGLSQYLASRIVAQGDIPCIQIGRRRMLAESAIQRWQSIVGDILESPIAIPQDHRRSVSGDASKTGGPDKARTAASTKNVFGPTQSASGI
jgi:hypothetical protein